MKLRNKLLAALCLALIACLAVPSILPASTNIVTAQAEAKAKLNKTKATVCVGEKLRLRVKNADGAVKWSSGRKAVATVNSKGVVTAKKPGTATIYARVNGKKLKCKVTVKAALTANKTKLTIEKDKSKKVKLTWRKKGDLSISYDTVGIVDCKLSDNWKGDTTTMTLKALTPGTVTVTVACAKTKDSVSIKVTVPGKEEKPEQPAGTELKLTLGETKPIKVSYPYVNASWSNRMVISCAYSGQWDGNVTTLYVTGISAGTSTLTFANSKGEVAATYNVVVTER